MDGKELVTQSITIEYKVNVAHDMKDAHTTRQKGQNVKGKRLETAEPWVSTVLVGLIWFIFRIVLHRTFSCRQTVVTILMEQH